MASGFICVDEPFVGHSVYFGHCGLVFNCRGILVTTAHCAEHFLDLGAHSRAQRHIVGTALNALTGALASGLYVGQGISLICPRVAPLKSRLSHQGGQKSGLFSTLKTPKSR